MCCGSCDAEFSEFDELPIVTQDSTCSGVDISFEDEALMGNCDQETVIDRTWSVVGCDSIATYVQRELRDTERSQQRTERRLLLRVQLGLVAVDAGQLRCFS